MFKVSNRHRFTTGNVAYQVFSEIFTIFSSPYAVRCLELFRANRHLELINLQMPEPSDYDDADTFADDYLCWSVCVKYADFEVDVDRDAVSMKKFFESEESCRSVNNKLTYCDVRGTLTPYMRDVLEMSRRKIAKCLGPFSWDLAEQHFGFGPGATNGLPRTRSDAYYKFGSKPTTTINNLDLAACAISRIPRWAEIVGGDVGVSDIITDGLIGQYDTHEVAKRLRSGGFIHVAGNKVVNVPKNAKTNRTIAAEPTMNGFIQRGIGRLIRSRLKRVGVDLDDQTHNNMLALAGSRDGTLATIDLSAASDTVSMKLVEKLLPADWCEAIKLCRSPRGTLPDNTQITYEKVSSMGNTYTFELESLIFWAFARTCMEITKEGRSQFGIYGDDIVVPVAAASTLIHVLSEFGFKTNKEKTYVDGPFRESCGKHYFRGTDVTPFFVKERPTDLQGLISLANAIRLYAKRRGGSYCDARFFPCWKLVVREIRHNCRSRLPRVPVGLGDIGLISNLDEATPTWDRQLFCHRARIYSGTSRVIDRTDLRKLVRQLYLLDRDPYGDREEPEMATYRIHKYGITYVTHWPDIGPWY
jgi:hypothetical protein